MPYIRNGQVVAQRSAIRFSVISDFVWKLLNVIGLFFGTMAARTPTRKRKQERGFHNYLGGDGGGGGGGGGDDGDGGDGRRRRNIHTLQPPPGGCDAVMGGG